MMRTTSPTPEIVREVTDRVLADPAYEDSVREIVLSKDLFETIGLYLKKIVEFIDRLAGGLANLSVDQPLLFWLIMAALIGVLALILWHIAYSLSLLFRASGSSSTQSPEETARVLRFNELWSQAHRLGDSGEYAEAIRHLLLALLARAHDRRVVLPAGWTNREIVAYLSGLSQVEAARELADMLGTPFHE